jgi:hypothetical protein
MAAVSPTLPWAMLEPAPPAAIEATLATARAQLEDAVGGPGSPWYHLVTAGVVNHLSMLCDQWCGYPEGSCLWPIDAVAGPLFEVYSSLAQHIAARELIVARKGGERVWRGDVLAKLWAKPTRSKVFARWALRERIVTAGEWQKAERKARLALQGPGPWPREPVW